ncbi:hypothetical protein [Nocardioides sp. 616]|nr:hypothetical protein [Nocardioides sp. 616]
MPRLLTLMALVAATATWNPTIHVAVGANLPAGVCPGAIARSAL